MSEDYAESLIQHEGFKLFEGLAFKQDGRMGVIQFPYGNPEEIIKDMISTYEEKGFSLIKNDPSKGHLLFVRENEERIINYSIGNAIPLIASIYNKNVFGSLCSSLQQ